MPRPEAGRGPRRDDLAACRALLRTGSRTFLAASMMLPARVREPACVLYAFCRVADDVVDVHGGGAAAVEGLRERLVRACAGRPLEDPVDRALADVVDRHAIPIELLEALLEGLQWDAAGRLYETLDDLQDYAARVAGSVGAMMAVLMGVRDRVGLARACELGVAMQMTNIARDVGEDARAGRIYLPLGWLREAGVDPQRWLAQPRFDPGVGAVVARLLDEAGALYRGVDDGIARLPLSCRPGIDAARRLYAQIGREVERRGMDSVSGRAFVPGLRKMRLLVEALEGLRAVRAEQAAPAMPAIAFLVEAAASPDASVALARGPRWQVPAFVGVVELFERLERRDREVRGW